MKQKGKNITLDDIGFIGVQKQVSHSDREVVEKKTGAAIRRLKMKLSGNRSKPNSSTSN